MTAEGRLHSMQPRERALALEVLGGAWQRLADRAQAAGDEPGGAAASTSVLAAVRAEAAELPRRYADVSADFAQHIGEAAVWYLDRATRRVGDPDRDGLTAAQRAVNLALFGSTADATELERLFAVASALNADDV
jgi:hypothetical protein